MLDNLDYWCPIVYRTTNENPRKISVKGNEILIPIEGCISGRCQVLDENKENILNRILYDRWDSTFATEAWDYIESLFTVIAYRCAAMNIQDYAHQLGINDSNRARNIRLEAGISGTDTFNEIYIDGGPINNPPYPGIIGTSTSHFIEKTTLPTLINGGALNRNNIDDVIQLSDDLSILRSGMYKKRNQEPEAPYSESYKGKRLSTPIIADASIKNIILPPFKRTINTMAKAITKGPIRAAIKSHLIRFPSEEEIKRAKVIRTINDNKSALETTRRVFANANNDKKRELYKYLLQDLDEKERETLILESIDDIGA